MDSIGCADDFAGGLVTNLLESGVRPRRIGSRLALERAPQSAIVNRNRYAEEYRAAVMGRGDIQRRGQLARPWG